MTVAVTADHDGQHRTQRSDDEHDDEQGAAATHQTPRRLGPFDRPESALALIMAPTMSSSRSIARSDRTRILFVAGAGRSGSTVLSNLLGSMPGLTSVGELRYLWERGIGERALCGCGEPVPRCPFWRSVLRSAYGDALPDVAAMIAADRRFLRVRTFPELLRVHGDPAALGPAGQALAGELARAYRAISAVAAGDVIVDASKLVSYGYLLANVDGVEVYLLHLTRDPRGVAHSWGRTRQRADRGSGSAEMARESPVKSALLWDLWNIAARQLWRGRPGHYVRLRYEDFVADPAGALVPVLRMLDIPSKVPLATDGSLEIAASHTVAGNPNRMRVGTTPLTADDEWRTAMPTGRRILVTALTAPVLHRFGYRVRRSAPSGDATTRLFVEDQSGVRRQWSRVSRNAGWVKDQGLRRVLEEKEIDPLRTIPAALRKWQYRRSRPVAPGTARPVFVVGVQRSGTNMLLRGLGVTPEVEVHNENDGRAFDRYRLRANETIEAIIERSGHSHVLFKPLCDSHRTDELLDALRTRTPGKAVWAYRDVDGRVRSAIAKFGDGNRQVLREYAAGSNTTRWHVQRMSPDTAALVRSFDYDTMTAESGAALMWYVRNRLYFDLGLDLRTDVHPVSYNSFVEAPETTMRALCAFLELPYSCALVAHVSARAPTHAGALDIDPRIRAACEQLRARLDAAALQAIEAAA